jgi:hypothetical protein
VIEIPVTFMAEHHTVYVAQNLDDVVKYTDWVGLKTMRGFTVFGLDVEATGLDPWSEDFAVTLVQISDGDQTYVLPMNVAGGERGTDRNVGEPEGQGHHTLTVRHRCLVHHRCVPRPEGH